MKPIPILQKQKYVAGFLFDWEFDFVALIRKNKPAWQRGKLNGIGGKIEAEETPDDAIVREFLEETGYQSRHLPWFHYCHMGGSNDDGSTFGVDFFAGRGVLSQLKTMELEEVVISKVSDIHPNNPNVIENLPWLIALAIDHLKDGRPSFVTADYK